jgi:hypothetical protein
MCLLEVVFMDISLILTAVLGAYIIISALVGLIKARKNRLITALVRLGITVAAAAAAVPLTISAETYSADYAYDFVVPMLGEGLAAFLTAVPIGAVGMKVVAAQVAAPVLYAIIFLLVRFALSVVLWVVEKIVPFLKKRRAGLLPRLVGAVNGALVAAVVLIPLCGFLMLGSSLLHTFHDADMMDTAFVRENIMEPLALEENDAEELATIIETDPVVSVVYSTIGKPVFETLTTASLDATDSHGAVIPMHLETELCGLLKTAGYGMEVMESFDKEDYTPEDKELLFATADTLFSSEWVKYLATDTLVALSESWLNGEAFAGIERPKMDATLNPTLNRILEVLASENGETLEEDIHVILDVVGDLLVSDLLGEDNDYTEMVQRMGQSGLLTDMLAKLEANERMETLAAELKALSIRLVSNMLGVDKLQSGEYAEMMDSVADTLTQSLAMSEAERDAIILDSVKNNFADQGFEVPDDVALKMSHQMIDELGADGEITKDELTDYLVNHADEGFEFAPDQIPDDLPI